jgi:hypothetical protein
LVKTGVSLRHIVYYNYEKICKKDMINNLNNKIKIDK